MKSRTRIQVVYGGVMDPLAPRVEDIRIEDIAHSLSNQCRYGGHVKTFYSVADHSIRVSLEVPKEDALWGLLHDASEAYLTDVPSPLKNALFGDQYREVEDQLMDVITEKFGLDPEMPASVRYADNALLRTEVRDLLDPLPSKRDTDDLWSTWFFAEELPKEIVPLTPDMARVAFMARYYALTGFENALEGGGNRVGS